METNELKVLVYGHKGWIGGKFINAIQSIYPEWKVVKASQRADDRKCIE